MPKQYLPLLGQPIALYRYGKNVYLNIPSLGKLGIILKDLWKLINIKFGKNYDVKLEKE